MAAAQKPLEVLALQGDSESLQRLATGLRQAGLRVDLVVRLDELRDAFFHRGGHDALLIGPDVPGPLARSATRCLNDVDGAVRVLVFGDHHARRDEPDGARPLLVTTFHPSSRAGLGAVLRLLRPELPRSA